MSRRPGAAQDRIDLRRQGRDTAPGVEPRDRRRPAGVEQGIVRRDRGALKAGKSVLHHGAPSDSGTVQTKLGSDFAKKSNRTTPEGESCFDCDGREIWLTRY